MASAYYESSRAAEEADDFDEFDPTPYGGGYDLFVTYGRPLPPSEETCHPCSEPSTSYDAPHYSASEPSPYGHHAKAKPNYGFRPQQEQQPSYGGGGYGSRPEPAAEEGGGYGSGYGSGYGRKNPEEESYGSGYGSGYGRKPQAEESYVSGGYGAGYGGQARPEQGYGSAVYGSGYGAEPQAESYGSGYGRKPQVEESYGSGYGRKPQVEESYGSGYGSAAVVVLGAGQRRPSSCGTAPPPAASLLPPPRLPRLQAMARPRHLQELPPLFPRVPPRAAGPRLIPQHLPRRPRPPLLRRRRPT